jgi:outer membrane protein OmpA-like peptidoglycan-associated protein
MTKQFARPAVRLAVVVALAMGAAACETMSDLDPTGLLSDDTAPLPADDSAPTAGSDANVTTPDLAALPPRPSAPDTAQQAQAAQQVAAAGAQAQYSADVLRAGTEAAAPPPVPASGAASVTQSALDAPPTAEAAPPTAVASAAPPSAAAGAVPPAAEPPTAEPPSAEPPSAALPGGEPPNAQVASAAPPSAQVPSAQAPAAEAAPTAGQAPVPAPVTTASMAPPPGAEPAVPAVSPGGPHGTQLATATPSDAALGFKPSAAPPLNPDISKWVSAPILAHYRQTAALARSGNTTAAVPGGAVAAPNGAGTAAGMIAAMNGGVPPTEIIYFHGDGVSLSSAARKQVGEAAAAFKANGGNGTVKVVGHSSSRTGNMSVERHLEVIFQKSQQRANAVAQALIKAGVPASKVVVEAVGDSQPIYYESMPRGEEGNRRAEIFLQG